MVLQTNKCTAALSWDDEMRWMIEVVGLWKLKSNKMKYDDGIILIRNSICNLILNSLSEIHTSIQLFNPPWCDWQYIENLIGKWNKNSLLAYKNNSKNKWIRFTRNPGRYNVYLLVFVELTVVLNSLIFSCYCLLIRLHFNSSYWQIGALRIIWLFK